MRIEIIGIWDDKIYSIGEIDVKKSGDVYFIPKQKGFNFHASRHASGSLHWKSSQSGFFQFISQSTPIDKFKGIEQLGSVGFSPINSAKFSRLHPEYKMKKRDGLCAIDLRFYQEGFSLMIFVLTDEGMPHLYTASNIHTKRQIYLYADSSPMIGVIVGALGSENP